MNSDTQRQPDNAQPIIQVRGLTKRFATVQAVAGVDFDVQPGELFGFLGPNGAGKTTTINLLTGLARPDSGTIKLAGIDCSRKHKAAQHLLGIIPDESNLYPELTGFENLCFCAALYGMPRRERIHAARQLLDSFGLTAAADRKFAGYSKGMKRKLTIAAGIIHNPPIIFLDEPTTGIDIAAARQIRQLLGDLNRNGATIFLTTHYIEEAQRLCGRIAFIVSGKIVRTDSVSTLLEHARNRQILQIAVPANAIKLCNDISLAFPALQCHAPADDMLRIESAEPIRVGPLVRFIEDRGVEVAEARKMQPSLEEVFVEITGIEAADMRKDKEKAGAGA